MSDLLSGLSRAGAVIQGVGQATQDLAGLLDGGAAGVVQSVQPGGVNIGGVDLYAFEIPEDLKWGSEQEIKTQRMPGGAKVLQLMGGCPKPITLRGLMLGVNAVDRARLLEQLVFAGTITSLAFGDFEYRCVVRSFEADYHSAFWQRDYELVCETLPDAPTMQAAGDDPSVDDPLGASQTALSGSLSDVAFGIGAVATAAQGIISAGQVTLNSVAAIMTPSFGLPSAPYVSTAQAGLMAASVAVGGLGSLAAGAGALASAVGGLQAVSAIVASGMQATGAALTLAASNGGTDLLNVNDLLGAAAAAGAQTQLVSMGYAASRATVQIGSATEPSPVKPGGPAATWAPTTTMLAIVAASADRVAQGGTA